MQSRIERAKELLQTVRHASMATVNADGSPHNTPYFFAYSPDLKHLYWRSRTETQHSGNIARTGRLFVVVYEAVQTDVGLYIEAQNARIAEGDEFLPAVTSFNAAKERAGSSTLDAATYRDSLPELYIADIKAWWINGSEEDAHGVIVRDFRQEITAQDLLN